MTYTEILFLILIGFALLTTIGMIAYYKIYDVIYEKRLAESKRKNLPYYCLVQKVKEAGKDYCRMLNETKETKKAIDALLAEMPYLTTADKLKTERDIEYLRYQLKEQKEWLEFYDEKEKRLRKEAEALKDYLKELGEKIY